MILTDHKIKEYGQKLVAPFAEDRVQAVGYDLTAKPSCSPPSRRRLKSPSSPWFRSSCSAKKKLHCPPTLRRPFNCETAAFAKDSF